MISSRRCVIPTCSSWTVSLHSRPSINLQTRILGKGNCARPQQAHRRAEGGVSERRSQLSAVPSRLPAPSLAEGAGKRRKRRHGESTAFCCMAWCCAVAVTTAQSLSLPASTNTKGTGRKKREQRVMLLGALADANPAPPLLLASLRASCQTHLIPPRLLFLFVTAPETGVPRYPLIQHPRFQLSVDSVDAGVQSYGPMRHDCVGPMALATGNSVRARAMGRSTMAQSVCPLNLSGARAVLSRGRTGRREELDGGGRVGRCATLRKGRGGDASSRPQPRLQPLPMWLQFGLGGFPLSEPAYSRLGFI